MSLIRGVKGLCPCPICLVPKEKQADLSVSYPLRTAKDTMKILREADSCQYAYQREDILKSHGLRNVKVKFQMSILCI
jgi:hypothetical protein